MTMRPSKPAALTLALTATLAAFAAVPAHAEPSVPRPVPACVASDSREFPLTTRLHGGPGAYEPGGEYGTWYLDLTNTTARTCTGIHPVVVLVDSARALKPGQARMEFYAEGRPHPVDFEVTDQDELVGAFDGFPGFTVGPRETVSVRVRLMLTSDATAPNDITANAAVVQRHGDDGDWIGQSNDYRFTIGSGPLPTQDPDADADPDAATATAAAPTAPTASPDAGRSPSDAAEDAAEDTAEHAAEDAADELASTGLGVPATVLGAACLLTGSLAAVGAALLPARRRR
ncbi:hypothetical protein [Streptomyces sp. NPDC018693]|uniref:hypothetical protein n=1 Tax=unclassified Streptomyces TaxID=2593676 RepID=UPI0037A4B3EF